MIPPKQTQNSVTLKTNKQFMQEALLWYPDVTALVGGLDNVTRQIRDDVIQDFL